MQPGESPPEIGKPDVRTLHGTSAARAVLRTLRSQSAGQRLYRDRTFAPRTHPGGQGPHQPHLCPVSPVPRKHPQGDRGANRLPREGLHLGRDSLQRGNQAGPAVRGGGSRPPAAQLHRYGTPPARHPARGALGCGHHPDGKGDAAEHGPRGHRGAAQREDHADAGQGNAAARGVLARPDGSGDEEPAGSAGGPPPRDRAGAAGAVPPHQEQRRAHRRARRRQDGHRRGPGAEDRLRRRAALPRRQAACSRWTSR